MLFAVELEKLMGEFACFLHSKRKVSSATVSNYLRDIRYFCAFYQEKMRVCGTVTDENQFLALSPAVFFHQLTQEEICQYFVWMQKEKSLSKATCARHLASLKALYKFFISEDENFPNPVKSIPTPKIQRNPVQPLSEEEVQNLLDHLSGVNYFRDYAIFWIILSGRLRIKEVCALNLSDYQDGILMIRDKEEQIRKVSLSTEAKEALDEYIFQRHQLLCEKNREESALFLSYRRNQRMAVITLQKMIQKKMEESGHGNAATHMLRRSGRKGDGTGEI